MESGVRDLEFGVMGTEVNVRSSIETPSRGVRAMMDTDIYREIDKKLAG